jgi:hypothetical protein
MKNARMNDKIDYTSAEHAHWRIDSLAESVDKLMEITSKHDTRFARLEKIGNRVVGGVYVLGLILVASELGVLAVLRKVIGI